MKNKNFNNGGKALNNFLTEDKNQNLFPLKKYHGNNKLYDPKCGYFGI